MDEDAADLGAIGHAVQLLAELKRALKILPMCGERRSCPVLKNMKRIMGELEAEIKRYDEALEERRAAEVSPAKTA